MRNPWFAVAALLTFLFVGCESSGGGQAGTTAPPPVSDSGLVEDVVEGDAGVDTQPSICSADEDCDDGNVCTIGVCDADGTCAHQPQEGACEDGDACSVNDTCVGGACAAGAPLLCDDGLPCTVDGCDPSSGCSQAFSSANVCDGSALVTCVSPDLEPEVQDCALDGLKCEDGACIPLNVTCANVRVVETRLGSPVPASVAVFFAVDTCSGQPVVALDIEDFTILEDEDPISATEAAATLLPRDTELFISLVLDASPSMQASGVVVEAVAAAKAFVQQVESSVSYPPVRFSVSFFTKDLQVVQPHTANVEAVSLALDALLAEQGAPTTNLYGSLIQAIDLSQAAQAERRSAMKGGVLTLGQVVMFTDGSDQAALYTLDAALAAVAGTADDILTIALGGEVDADVLGQLGKDGFFAAEDADALGVVFTKAAQRVALLQKRTYLLGYCSPKLAGDHALQIDVLKGVGTSGLIEFNADTFNVDDPALYCTAGAFASACDEQTCGGLICGGCFPDGRACIDELVQSPDSEDVDLVAQCGCWVPEDCDDGISCTADVCDQETGYCSNTPSDALCDDSVACTLDQCDLASNCSHTPQDSVCDDEHSCTTEHCDLSDGCQVLTDDALCDDGYSCSQDACVVGAGCVNTPDEALCDDAVACTEDECVLAGLSETGCANTPKPPEACDDGVACTHDECDATLDCTHQPDASLCDDSVACTQDACDLTLGCQHAPEDGACSDGVACTIDSCHLDNDCQSEPFDAACEDGVACSIDTCHVQLGCVVELDHPACEDGVPCTKDSCAASEGCAQIIDHASCDDEAVCTTDSCDPALGCQNDTLDVGLGDTCADAVVITLDPGVWQAVDGDTFCHQDESATACAADGPGAVDRFYVFSLAVTSRLQASLNTQPGSDWDMPAQISLAKGCAGAASTFACSDKDLDLQAEPGAWYLVVQSPDAEQENPFTLSIVAKPVVSDGQSCVDALDCASGHCEAGICCQGGECCATAEDCEPTGATPVCTSPSTCQGSLLAPVCQSHQCLEAELDDDSGCTAGTPGATQGCGAYPDVTCTGAQIQAEQKAACASDCLSTDDCKSPGHWCESETQICLPKGSNGDACQVDQACASGHCVDGVCCDGSCDGLCESCSLPEQAGECEPIPEGQDPADECAGAGECSVSCDGAGACAELADGDTDGVPDGCDNCPDLFNPAQNPCACTDCGDGDPCTDDVCAEATGACANPPVECEGEFCLPEACDPVQGGCVLALDLLPCDDNDLCTDDFCDPNDESCLNPPLSEECDDDNGCTTDACLPDVGCTSTPIECSDGLQCVETPGAGPAFECVDPDCYDDATWVGPFEQGCSIYFTEGWRPFCDADGATEPCPVACGVCECEPECDGKECGDDGCGGSCGTCDPDNPCLGGGSCEQHACVYSNPCADDDACTNDPCQLVGDGVSYDCPGGGDVVCDDGNACTTDTCHQAQGCKHTPLSPCCGDGVTEGAEECDDGNFISGDACTATCHTPPPNDTCSEAHELILSNAGVATHSGTTAYAFDHYKGLCPAALSGGPDVVYKFGAGTGQTLNVTVDASFDTVLYVQTLACGDGGVPLACSTTGDLTIPGLAGGDYWLFVDGVDETHSGAYDLAVTVD